MDEQIWRGVVTSATTRNRDGTPKLYTVTLVANGTGTCNCMNYILEGINKDDPSYRCKHIKTAADSAEFRDLLARAQVQAAPAGRIPATAITRDRAARRRQAVNRDGRQLQAPQAAPKPAPPRLPPLGLSDADITRVAHREKPQI